MGKKISVSDEQIVEAAKNSLSGAAAAVKLGIKYDTFRVHAKRLGVFNPNPSGKGITKPINDDRKFVLQDILEGKHPQYSTGKLKRRMIEGNLLKNNNIKHYILSDDLELNMYVDDKNVIHNSWGKLSKKYPDLMKSLHTSHEGHKIVFNTIKDVLNNPNKII